MADLGRFAMIFGGLVGILGGFEVGLWVFSSRNARFLWLFGAILWCFCGRVAQLEWPWWLSFLTPPPGIIEFSAVLLCFQ